jgi:GntR family transcriptional regulator / MocR family aminotransferase
MSGRKSLLNKRRRRSIIAFEMIRLDRSAAEPLHEQLYRQICDELRSGIFSDTSNRLPSSRALATDLGISRATVRLTFSKLHAEGYIRSQAGSGTFVAAPLPETFLSTPQPQTHPQIQRAPRISDRVRKIPDERVGKQFDLAPTEARVGVSLISSVPGVSPVGWPFHAAAVDEFPIAAWEQLRAHVLAKKGIHLLRYASNRGDADLRKAIAAYLCDFRGARCHPDQIVIVAGMQQAILISAMALLDPGEIAWIEDPGYQPARRAFTFASATVVPRPIDQEGIVIVRSPKQPLPRIIYTTPSSQFPLGVTMSFGRRTALLDFARNNDAFVFEDDYNSEFRFTGPPLPCLQGLDNSGRAIYAGTMSKILYPSLRLGYIVAPEPLVDSFVKARSVMDQHSPAIDQATLARFITEGFFLRHVKRMRKLYSERRDFFIDQFNRLLGDHFILQIPEAGLHLLAWLRCEADFERVARVRTEIRISPTSLSFFCIQAKLNPAFVFAFAAWTPSQIRESLVKLASALKAKRI